MRELIAGGHSKAALQLAKDLHKRDATPDSETLLIDAYRARIEDILKLRMTVEARALFAIVRERFPAAVPRLADIDRDLCALEGRFDEIVAPLRDASLNAADRERIETFIRQRIEDLPALAAVASLPPEHPLRSAASALAAALQAVTEGPVDDELLALAQVSRRSPLAPWKALVRAIACYCRREDAECRNWLRTIATDSVPARVIPALTAMLGATTEGRFSAAERRLIAAAGDHDLALRCALATLESALVGKKRQPILDAARAVAAAGAGCDPALRERLRQHIAVRCLSQHIPRQSIDAALGGPPRQDAYFYRLMARSLEGIGSAESSAEAVIVWEAFRRAAIRESWFAAGGQEDGVLSLHMAQTVAKLPDDVVEEMEDREAFYHKPRTGRINEGFPSVEQLYERACEADPCAEAFQAWLGWANNHRSWKVADDVAERWRRARPGEIQPLLHLMESAEKRNAFKKSLTYLEEAEELDRLNPDVRRAKARLLLFAALRHLRQGKTHLVLGEIEHLLAIPAVRPGEIFALAAALRWCCAAIERDDTAQQKREAELSGSMGPVGAHLLVLAVVRSAELSSSVFAPRVDVRHSPPAELLAGAVRVCSLGEWAGLRIPMLCGWTGKLIEALKQPAGSVDAAQLRVLGEAALSDSARELAYAVSGAGLALGTANARFLFLRARALPPRADLRREGCFTAALELAWREHDTDLAAKILDWLNGRARGGFGWFLDESPAIARRPSAPQLLNAILHEELELNKFPAVPSDDEPRYAVQLIEDRCNSRCPAKRGDPLGACDHEHDGEDEDDFDVPGSEAILEKLAGVLGALPPSIAQQVKKAIEAGEDPLAVVAQTIGGVPPLPERRGSAGAPGKPKTPAIAKLGKKESTTPAQPPAQTSLF